MESFCSLMVLLVPLLLHLFFGYASSKECTNNLPQLSHTLRHQLSQNETLKNDKFLKYHLTPTDDSAWSDLLPRKMLKQKDESSWNMMYRAMKNFGTDGSKGFLKQVSLHDVRIDPQSMHGRAQQINLEYLLILDVDRLSWSFRKTAGLTTPGKPYGGWEEPTSQLRGHFVGHYLSASAQTWASTGNETIREKMTELVSIMAECQHKMGTGYLSAFPSQLFDKLEAVQYVWAPYYTIHKIMAGLLDQYQLGKNRQALEILKGMANYFYKRVKNVIKNHSIERHWQILNEETGGMNDLLYQLYTITGDQKHLILAHLFDKPCFLGLLAMQVDSISGFHANTHIPVVVGAQMRYEVTGDPLYKEMGMYFMDIVNSSHSYATGGTSVREFWDDPKRLASSLETQNEESCSTYNMLKVSRHLFRWTKEMAYADYYERALTNGVLSIQRGTEPGVMIYFLPMERGASKSRSKWGWGTKFDSFWCCYGTGIESFSKLGDSIYFEEEGKVPGLYIIQFISSLLDWEPGKILLNQKVEPVVSWDPRLCVTFTLSPKEKGGTPFSTLHLRIPSWTNSNGAKATLNAQSLPLPPPGSFLTVSARWNTSDKITLELPLNLRTEAIKDDRPEYASVHAILYGHFLLAGLTGGDWDIKADLTTPLASWISPISSTYNTRLHTLSQESSNSIFVLTNSNQSLAMEELPKSGTDSSVHATFRLISKDSTSSESTKRIVIGESIVIEPFDFPGMVVIHNGKDRTLGISDSSGDSSSIFCVAPGLDGRNGTISLESKSLEGCFVYSSINYEARANVRLRCSHDGSYDPVFKKAASFTLRDGISKYHPMSFIARGGKRNFLLTPLLSLRDESYTIYFNIQA